MMLVCFYFFPHPVRILSMCIFLCFGWLFHNVKINHDASNQRKQNGEKVSTQRKHIFIIECPVLVILVSHFVARIFDAIRDSVPCHAAVFRPCVFFAPGVNASEFRRVKVGDIMILAVLFRARPEILLVDAFDVFALAFDAPVVGALRNHRRPLDIRF